MIEIILALLLIPVALKMANDMNRRGPGGRRRRR